MNMPQANSNVIVAPAINDELLRLRDVDPAQATSIVRAILSIPDGAERIDLVVPGDPDGTRYWAVRPDNELAAVPVFRQGLPEEHANYAVEALFPAPAYQLYHRHPDPRLLNVAATTTVGATITAEATATPAPASSASA